MRRFKTSSLVLINVHCDRSISEVSWLVADTRDGRYFRRAASSFVVSGAADEGTEM